MSHYTIIVGARPNFIKAAPLLKALKESEQHTFTLIHTGQHFDHNMSEIFFKQMKMPKPDVHLQIHEGNFANQIGNQFSDLKQAIRESGCDGVIVFGDINSTLAGAIAAKSENKKLIHIESGLRSHDKRMPEELNRIITDHTSDLLFVTEQSGVDNLLAEGVNSEKIKLVGNIMIESIELFRDTFNESTVLSDLELESDKYVVATIHRIENTSDAKILSKILTVLNEIAEQYKIVFPLHPGTKKYIESQGLSDLLKRLLIVEPIGYIDFMKLIMESSGVITDSGGIQEETSHLSIPCCTVRDNTERPVTVSLGTNKLFPIAELKAQDIINHINREDFTAGNIPLWDGEVSKRIIESL